MEFDTRGRVKKEKKARKKGRKGSRKYGRNKEKCELYRQRVGKPNGPGQPGNRRH